MKKVFFALTILASSTIFLSCSSDDDDKTKSLTYDEVPTNSKEFLKDHFNNLTESDVISTKLDKDGTYEIKYRNGIEIDFYPNGVWKDIDLNNNALPTSIAMLLPENALNYISTTYPNAVIEEIEKTGAYSETGQGFKIELRDDRDIYFDANGNVLRDKGESHDNDSKDNIPINTLPTNIQTFLNTYFVGQTPNKIEKKWNKYEITYNHDQYNEIEIEFFTADDSFKSVETDTQNEIVRNIITGVSGSNAILNYLDANFSGQPIEEFSVAAKWITMPSGGYVVELDGKPDYKVYFNTDGSHYLTIRD